MAVTGPIESVFGSLRNGYHVEGRQQARELPNPQEIDESVCRIVGVFSCVRRPFSSLCVSISVSLFLSPCDVVCVVVLRVCECVWWCVCWCVCWCVLFGTLKKRTKTMCRSQHASVCRFKTSWCVPATRPHVFEHVDVLPVYTGAF